MAIPSDYHKIVPWMSSKFCLQAGGPQIQTEFLWEPGLVMLVHGILCLRAARESALLPYPPVSKNARQRTATFLVHAD